MPVAVPKDLVEFLTSGVCVLVATRSADLVPEAVRAFAPAITPDRQRLDVIVPNGLGDRTIANLRDNAQIAVAFSRPIDHVTVQVKGACVALRPTTDEDRLAVERFRTAYIEVLYLIGMPRSLTSRFRALPGTVVTLEVTGVYNQTPGPRAGEAIGTR